MANDYLLILTDHSVGSIHLQADHWRSIAAQGRSLWQLADSRESRSIASLLKHVGGHEISVQAAWQSGLAGSLNVDGRNWPVAGLRGKIIPALGMSHLSID